MSCQRISRTQRALAAAHRVGLLLFAAAIFCPLISLGADPKSAAADKPFDVVVTADSTRVMAGEKPIGEVTKGAQLTVSQSNGDWYLIDAPNTNPPQQGWIRKSDVKTTLAAATVAQLTPAQKQERLKERDRYRGEAKQLFLAGKLRLAIAPAEKSLAIEQEVLGNDHPDTIGSLQNLARMRQESGDFALAHALFEEALEGKTRALGKDHWQVTDARLDLTEADIWARLKPEERDGIVRSFSSLNEAGQLVTKGDVKSAVSQTKEAIELQTRLLGPKHRTVVQSNLWLARIFAAARQYRAAEPVFTRVLEINKEILGEKHPDYVASITNLANDCGNMGDYAKAEKLFRQALPIEKEVLGEQHPNYLTTVNNFASLYSAMGEYAKAESLFQQAVQIRKDTLGEKHPDYATSLSNLAVVYHRMAQYSKAETFYRQAMQIRRDSLGEHNADYASSLNNLGMLYQDMGDYSKAEPLRRQALQIHKELLGENHPKYGDSLAALASLYQDSRDYAKAEPLLRQVLQIRKDTLGDRPPGPDYAESLTNLASLYSSMGDYSKAEPLYRQALAIFKESLGEKHPEYALGLDNLGLVYKSVHDYTKAEALFLESLRIHKEVFGEKHPACATDMRMLAALYHSMGDSTKAERFYRQAAEIWKQTSGEKHVDYARNLNSLGVLYAQSDEYSKAESIFLQAAKIEKELFGPNSQDYGTTLCNLAFIYDAGGQYGKAVPLLRESLDTAHQRLELTASVQSERQQETMRNAVWSYLDEYLHAMAKAGLPAEQAYNEVLRWKGEVAGRQQRLRQLRRQLAEGNDKAAVQLAVDLADATGSLARLYRSTSANTPQREAQLAELRDRVERLQEQLAEIDTVFRQQRNQQHRTADDIRNALPADAVLVDLLGTNYFQPSSDPTKGGIWSHDLIAFVVRPGRPVERVELGAVTPIEAEIDHWRQSFGAKSQDDDPGTELRKLLWQPLEKYIAGANLVLISPNGATAPLPWGALPGKEPGTYLIDEFAIAVVPIPAALPEMMAGDSIANPAADPTKHKPSLLLVGDVDFGADPGNRDLATVTHIAARGGGQFNWPALPGTRDEVAAIQSSFAKQFGDDASIELAKDRATKSAVQSEAGRCEYLHFSTHGFFAPSETKSAVAAAGRDRDSADNALVTAQDASDYQPGLLSGLVFAGANKQYADSKEDGILTALEVAEMDLSHVRLATLSACETGLGKSAGAEGLLGLQRAFQTAGAKSVVASLWKVPDKATELLMSRFYDNLWRKRMPKLEALREAQRWLLHEGKKQRELSRGLELTPDTEEATSQSGAMPPRYWAGFVLSGDWR